MDRAASMLSGLQDAMMPNFSSVAFMVAPFIHCPAMHAQHA
jgi:hypothetical protein